MVTSMEPFAGREEDNLERLMENAGQGVDAAFEDEASRDEPEAANHQPLAYKISNYGSDLEVELLVSRLQRGTYIIPDYQRGYVWTPTRASQFIESLLLGLPIPGIFLYREDSNRFLVIDGHQRLKSLQAFFEGKFPGGRPFALKGVEARFEGKTFQDLDPDDQRGLQISVIHATIIEQELPVEAEKSSIYQIFKRINAGSVPLTPHEIRYCVNYGEFGRAIKAWNQDPNWRALIGPTSSRMKDQELMLRFFALFFSHESYKPSMQGFLDNFMQNHRENVVISGVNCELLFREASAAVVQKLGTGAFRSDRSKSTGPINMALAEAIMVSTARLLQQNRLADDLISKRTALLEDAPFMDAIGTATATSAKVALRLKVAYDAFEAS